MNLNEYLIKNPSKYFKKNYLQDNMIMENNNRDVLLNLLRFMGERDLAKLVGLFASQVDWDIPGDKNLVPWLGKRKSKAEIVAFFQLLWKHTEPISASVETMLMEGGQGVVIGEFCTKMLLTGKEVNSFFCIHVSLKNNLIIKYRLYENSYAVSESLKRADYPD